MLPQNTVAERVRKLRTRDTRKMTVNDDESPVIWRSIIRRYEHSGLAPTSIGSHLITEPSPHFWPQQSEQPWCIFIAIFSLIVHHLHASVINNRSSAILYRVQLCYAIIHLEWRSHSGSCGRSKWLKLPSAARKWSLSPACKSPSTQGPKQAGRFVESSSTGSRGSTSRLNCSSCRSRSRKTNKACRRRGPPLRS